MKYEPKKGYENKSNLGLDTPSDSGVSRSGKGVRGKGKPFLVLYFLYILYMDDLNDDLKGKDERTERIEGLTSVV